VAGCGGGGGDEGGPSLESVVAQVDGLTGQARERKLLALAKSEGGELNLYTSSSIELMSEVTDAFEDAYDLDVSVFKSNSQGLVQRIVEERDAGFHGADVSESNEISLRQLADADALAAYRPPGTAALVAGSGHGSWTADKFDTLVVAWNTDNVAAGDRPRSYEDLADPRWHGKLGLEIDDGAWYKALRDWWVASGKTPAEADRLFQAIARNAMFADSRSLLRQLLAAGELDVLPSIQRHNIEDMIRDGAPIAYEPAVEPAFTRPDGVAIVAGSPHPAAALLFADWLLDGGQKVMADFGADVARRDLVVAPTIERQPVEITGYLAAQDEWDARYERLTRLGGEVDESG
jgi:iron(III) transport system substrate-binding protein